MNAQQFIDALHRLEDGNELDIIVGLFGEGAEVTNPHMKDQHAGQGGAQRFWQQYRSTFGTIHSHFFNVIEVDSAAVFEWESKGTLKPGNEAVT